MTTMSRIDLHSHTTYSDGSFSPTALVELAHEKNVRVLSITDHDTTDGLPEAMSAAKIHSIEIIPGIEISSSFQGQETHILGYFIKADDTLFQKRLTSLRTTRMDRIQEILKNLNQQQIEVSFSEVQQVSATGTIGRPHIANVLLQKGYVKNFQEAFDRYLGTQGTAYVKRIVPETQEVFKWISEAGGISVLAHPFWQGLNHGERLTSCQQMVAQGLRGIEVFYGNFSAKQISINLNLARHFNLIVTGGSDFHGTFKPNLSLGTGRGDLHVPPKVVESLRLAARKEDSHSHSSPKG